MLRASYILHPFVNALRVEKRSLGAEKSWMERTIVDASTMPGHVRLDRLLRWAELDTLARNRFSAAELETRDCNTSISRSGARRRDKKPREPTKGTIENVDVFGGCITRAIPQARKFRRNKWRRRVFSPSFSLSRSCLRPICHRPCPFLGPAELRPSKLC